MRSVREARWRWSNSSSPDCGLQRSLLRHLPWAAAVDCSDLRLNLLLGEVVFDPKLREVVLRSLRLAFLMSPDAFRNHRLCCDLAEEAPSAIAEGDLFRIDHGEVRSDLAEEVVQEHIDRKREILCALDDLIVVDSCRYGLHWPGMMMMAAVNVGEEHLDLRRAVLLASADL